MEGRVPAVGQTNINGVPTHLVIILVHILVNNLIHNLVNVHVHHQHRKGAGIRTNEYQLTLCSALQRACY